MDPLSDLLSLLKPQKYVSAGFDAAGPWSIAFPQTDGLRYNIVVSGACWLAVDGMPEPIRVVAGDCCILPRGLPYRLASELALPSQHAYDVFANAKNGGIAVVGGGGEFFGLGGFFELGGRHAAMLVEMLPPIVHIHDRADAAALRATVERMMDELREPQPGGALIVQFLAQTILIQALRLQLTEGPRTGVGWLFALADPEMRAAIAALHAEPAYRWTVAELASCVGLSRSTFALKFKAAVGASPMEYLTRWRMMLAADRLVTGSEPVSAIAFDLGYESESAFAAAFKRVTGISPRRYGRAPLALAG